MLIDWFTVSAQAVNFLVLVWLLKRFLYKPILDAIAAREKRISDQLADANAKKTEAQKEQDDFKQKSDAFDKQKMELLSNAKKEADESREKLLKEAQAEADTLRSKRKEALKNEEHDLNQEIIRRTKQEIFAIAAKALRDLADVSLEERMCAVFIKHLQSLTDEEKHTLASALQVYSPSTLVTSAFALATPQQQAIKAAVREISGTDKDKLQFKIVPELVSGIELSVSGHKLAWSIADYLGTLEKSIDEAMERPDTEEKAKSQPEPAHAA
jgi:F-type H+-transporting ATPase subunit b